MNVSLKSSADTTRLNDVRFAFSRLQRCAQVQFPNRLEKAISAASALLEVPARDLDIEEGMVIQPGKNLSISLREIADSLAGVPGYKIAAGLAPGLEAAVNFEISELRHGLGVHALELTVDPYTGTVSLLNYVVVNDCGKAINPQMAEGQIHGGVVHGIGNTLFEWMAYDDSALPVNTTLADSLAYGLKSHPSKSNLSNSRAQKSAWREGNRRSGHHA